MYRQLLRPLYYSFCQHVGLGLINTHIDERYVPSHGMYPYIIIHPSIHPSIHPYVHTLTYNLTLLTLHWCLHPLTSRLYTLTPADLAVKAPERKGSGVCPRLSGRKRLPHFTSRRLELASNKPLNGGNLNKQYGFCWSSLLQLCFFVIRVRIQGIDTFGLSY